MAIYAPISGGYIHFAERWVSPAVGFALGWQVSIQYCISAPSEMIAADILISYWDTPFPVANQAGYITAFIVVAGVIVGNAEGFSADGRTFSVCAGTAKASLYLR